MKSPTLSDCGSVSPDCITPRYVVKCKNFLEKGNPFAEQNKQPQINVVLSSRNRKHESPYNKVDLVAKEMKTNRVNEKLVSFSQKNMSIKVK